MSASYMAPGEVSRIALKIYENRTRETSAAGFDLFLRISMCYLVL